MKERGALILIHLLEFRFLRTRFSGGGTRRKIDKYLKASIRINLAFGIGTAV